MGGWEPTSIYYDQNIKYQWMTRGSNCRFCNIMSGRVYSLDVYMTSTVYPGFHANCDCYLKEVPSDTLESDMDIFGSSLDMRNAAWLEAFFGATKDIWLPGWYTNPHELLSFAKPGMTARQAMALLVKANKNKSGMFKDYGFPGNISYGWNVWRNVQGDLYKTTGQIISGWAGTFPKPAPLSPYPPAQTYHNPYYQVIP